MSELIEKETEEYRKGDPDPFDDRHPGKVSRMVLAAPAVSQCLAGSSYSKVNSF